MLLLNDKPVKYFTFPGGELQVRLEPLTVERATLTWKPRKADDIMLLLLTVNALKNAGISDIDLDILYLPYARQDRVCAEGEAYSLECICRILDNLDVSIIRIWDAHNESTTLEFFDKTSIINFEPVDIFQRYKIFDKIDREDLFLCAPDAGALHSLRKINKTFCFPSFQNIYFSKIRDQKTGVIIDYKLKYDSVSLDDTHILLIDDICDGGATFTKAAQILKEHGASKLYLYVTHGIFSKGLDMLNEYFEHIYCHHVLHDELYKSNSKLTILREFTHD